MKIKPVSKAVGAGTGGIIGVAGAAGAIALLPDGTPWYAYFAIIVLAMLLPVVTTYFAPGNSK